MREVIDFVRRDWFPLLVTGMLVGGLGWGLSDAAATIRREADQSRACRASCAPAWGEMRYAGGERQCWCDHSKRRP